jgi:hypothetical protein
VRGFSACIAAERDAFDRGERQPEEHGRVGVDDPLQARGARVQLTGERRELHAPVVASTLIA